jgi:membrane protein DedA with SNARE-associated domain
MDTLFIWISHYGYFGIFSLLVLGIIGLPIPDETLLTLSGYLIYKGTLHWVPTFIAAYLGSIIGMSISYAIGSTFGHHIILKYGHYVHITEERLNKTHNWFEKIGRWALLIGYFIPGVRHIVAILAGTSELQLWEFALFAYTGGFIWTAAFISVGFFFGEKWTVVLDTINEHIMILTLAAIVVFLLLVIFKKITAKRKKDDTTA